MFKKKFKNLYYKIIDTFVKNDSKTIYYHFDNINTIEYNHYLSKDKYSSNITNMWIFKDENLFIKSLARITDRVREDLKKHHGINFYLKGVCGYSIKKNDIDTEPADSEIFHYDYVNDTNYEYKLMILMSDVKNRSNGPLEYLPEQKIIRKEINRHRTRIKDNKPVNSNTFLGKIGDALLFPTNMIHRQGRVSEHGYVRNVLVLTFLPGFTILKPKIYQ